MSSHKCIIKKYEKLHLKTHQVNYWSDVSLQTKTTAFIQFKKAVKNAFPHFKVAEIVKYSYSTVFLTQLLKLIMNLAGFLTSKQKKTWKCFEIYFWFMLQGIFFCYFHKMLLSICKKPRLPYIMKIIICKFNNYTCEKTSEATESNMAFRFSVWSIWDP